MKNHAIITQIWLTANCILHASTTHGTKYDENSSSHHGGMCEDGVQQQKNAPNYSNLSQEQYSILVPDHSTKYTENPSNHHGGMHSDGQTDGQTRPFLCSQIPTLQSRE